MLKAKLLKVFATVSRYSLKLISPVQILWIRWKIHDLHHLQLIYFWPQSNFKEISDGLKQRLETLKNR